MLDPRPAILVVAFLAGGSPARSDEPPVDASVKETTAFVSGQGAYHTYRIPAIVMTNQGTLLAFCEGRKTGGGDAGDIDLLVARSADQGRTWSTPTIVWDDSSNTCGNPTPVVDRETGVVWLAATWNDGRDRERQIMEGESREARHPYMTCSADDGQSWREPQRISETTRLPHWRWYATGPGNAIQLTRGPHQGRLLVPANHSDHSDPDGHPYRSHVFWSDDHGQTWQLGGLQQDRTNESAVVELEGGSVLQLMRSYHGANCRAAAVSPDGGRTWGEQYLDHQLDTPVCQASALRYSWPEQNELGGKSRILFASPRGSKRDHLTVWLSYDDGKTWPVRKEIYAGSSAYSCLVKLPGNRIGLLYEKDNYKSIAFASFALSWLEAGLGTDASR